MRGRASSSGALLAALLACLACAAFFSEAGAQAVAGASIASKKAGGSSSTAALSSRCLVKASASTASYRVELAPVLEYDELMTAPPDAACWDLYSRNDTCTQSLACGMGDPTALRVQVANKCASSSSRTTNLKATINGVDADLVGATATLLPVNNHNNKRGASKSPAVLHITLPPLRTHTLKRRVCVQFNDRCPTLRDMCGDASKTTCQIELRGRPTSAAAKRTGCSQAGATFSVSSDALVQYDVDFSQKFTRPLGSNCPPRDDMQAYVDELGARTAAEVQASGDVVVETVPTGCMPLGTDRALISGIMTVVGPVGAGARAAAALKRVATVGPSSSLLRVGSSVGIEPEEAPDTGGDTKIPDFLSYLGAGFDAAEYYPYPAMDATSQALNPKQWLRSEPIIDRKSLGKVGYTESNVEVCQVKAELKTAKSASEARDVLGISAKASVSWYVSASLSAEYNKTMESTQSSETMMASSSIDCMVASYELKSVANYKPAPKFATAIARVVDWEDKRKEAAARGDSTEANRLRDRIESAFNLFRKDYGTSFVTRFNLGAFMYMTMQFEGGAMATRVDESASLEADLSTTFASVSGKVTSESARATSLANQAMNSRVTASPLAALPTFKPATDGDDAKQWIVDIQAWQADINAARKDPIGINKQDVDETNNQFYPFPDTKTHQFMWEWLDETLVYFDANGVGFWEDLLGGEYEEMITKFARLYKSYVYRITDAEKLAKLGGQCFPSPLVVKNPNTGACDSCLDSSLFGARRGYCNPRGTAACFWNSKTDKRPGCACAPPCYGVNPVTKLRDCYREGGRMHHPWARDVNVCPVRPDLEPLKNIPPAKECNTRYTSDGSPLSDLLRDRVWCSLPKLEDCNWKYCDVNWDEPEKNDRFCWKPPGQDFFGGFQFRNGQELAPTVYTVLATGCNSKGKCAFPIDKMLRQYAGATHACGFYSVRNQVDDCTHEVDSATGEVVDSLREKTAKPYFVDLPGPAPGEGTVVWSRVPPSKCLAQITVPPGGEDSELRGWVCTAGQYPPHGAPIPSFFDGVKNLGDDYGRLCPRV